MILAGLVILNSVAAGVAGFTICTARHRQRGLEVDSMDIVLPDLDPVGVS